ENGLTIFNTDMNCYNVWTWKLSTGVGRWESLCAGGNNGGQEGEVDFTDCNTIVVSGVYYSEKPLNQQDVTIAVPVRVVRIGSYSYSTIINGVTFSSEGIFTRTGNQIIY